MSIDPARLAVAQDVLAQLGITLADLQTHPIDQQSIPTLREYLPAVAAAAGPGANRTYGSYWARMDTAWGTRPLDEISASDIEAMQHRSAATAGTPASTSSPPPARSTTGPSPTGSSHRARALLTV